MTSVLTLPQTEKLSLSVRAKALVFEDPKSRALLARMKQVAPSSATVLISGETGTGKEIVARHLHDLSERADRPFLAVNCGAFSESLIESDLFGHEKGAFTGALTAKAGWFESANGGTLFLDEIGDLPLGAQVKLLRVLQEHEVVRLGSRHPIAVDVRLVAATNVRLEEAVAAGHFREDLYYRLAVMKMAVEPLRERPGDILPLARYFLGVYANRLKNGVNPALSTLTPAAERALLMHPWMGNIRELENAIHHALLICHDGQIRPDDLPLITMPPRRGPSPAVEPETPPPVAVAPAPAAGKPALDPRAMLRTALLALYDEGAPRLWDEIEDTVMRTAYEHSYRNQLQMARLLDMSRNVVRARLLQFGVLQRGTAPKTVVRIGCPRFGPLLLLKLNGALDRLWARRGIEIEWSSLSGGPAIIEAMRRGAIDLGMVGGMPSIFGQATQVPLVYLASEPPSPDDSVIMVHGDSPIRQVADLKGKTLALGRNTNSDYLVLKALEEAKLGYDDVNIAYSPAEGGARAAFEHREVDAWASWNPIVASVEQTRGARVLRDGAGVAGNVLCYVGTRAFSDANPELVDEFAQELRRMGSWISEKPEAAAKILAPHLEVDTATVAKALARRTFGARPVDTEMMEAQQIMADTLLRARRIPGPVTVSEARWVPPPSLRRTATAP